jgi:uncharacterized protein with GYD domain
MASYIVLCNFTEQGLRSVKNTVSRAAAAKEAASKFGVNMKEVYWTQGQYDVVTLLDANDEQSAVAFALALAGQGNIKMQTLRAFTSDEMSAIIKNVP